ncbi:MAG: hypothetical protein KGH69_00440 [Candidatus Micrarchaeota archaeon]|nr:hypothetical protein [Candidatus Micrarchaeota archaeon]
MDVRVCKGRDAAIKLDPDYIMRRIGSRQAGAVGMGEVEGRRGAVERVRRDLVKQVKIYADGRYYMLPNMDRMEMSGLVVDLSMSRALGEISENFYKEGMKEVMSALSKGRRAMNFLEGYPALKEFAHTHGMRALGDRLAEMRRKERAETPENTAVLKDAVRRAPAVALGHA